MQNHTTWQIFKSCIITRGVSRAIIQDTQRGKYFTIPLSLVDFINELSTQSISSIKSKLKIEEKEIVDEYLSFLQDNELVFECPKELIENFSQISEEYDYPAHISNAVIEINELSITNIQLILEQLSKLLCFNVVVIFKCNLDVNDLNNVLELLDNYNLNDVGLIINNSLDIDFYTLKSKFNFLTSFTFCNTNTASKSNYDSSLALNIIYTDKNLTNQKHCGAIDAKFFTLGITHYTESLNHNTCLNRKIAIDAEGNIKNCPSMKKSYGNIRDTTLEEAINKPGFKKYWNITKDEITKCKDCKFRHVCTDCRAYLENPDDIYSAPLKCGYNPYTCEWEEWSTNPLKQKAIEYYGMREIVNNEKTIHCLLLTKKMKFSFYEQLNFMEYGATCFPTNLLALSFVL